MEGNCIEGKCQFFNMTPIILLIGVVRYEAFLIVPACLLAKEKDVGQLILLARHRCKQYYKSRGSGKMGVKVELKTGQFDTSKREDTARVAEGADIIFNAIFPEFNLPDMEASLDVGVHYLGLLAYASRCLEYPRLEPGY